MNRAIAITRKVSTEFGQMYLHLDLNELGQPVGGSISTPMKEPDSQITKLVHQLGEALDHALQAVHDETEAA